MTAKLTPFSHDVGTIYRGFLTGNFYHYTLTISFCLRVSMIRMEKNWNLNILYNSHSLLFNSWIIKNDLQKMTLSFSFNIIIWYPFFRVWDMNKDNWEYWFVISYSDWDCFAPCDPGMEGGWWGVGRGWADRNYCQKTRCTLFPLSLGKWVSSAVIVKTILKLFYFKVRCGVSPFITLSLNLTHSVPR